MSDTGINLIAIERARQIEHEGWSPEHDAEHDRDDLAMAAVCYATPERVRHMQRSREKYWPWARAYWKPTPDDRVRELVKAGALIAAEIDRLHAVVVDRPATPTRPTTPDLDPIDPTEIAPGVVAVPLAPTVWDDAEDGHHAVTDDGTVWERREGLWHQRPWWQNETAAQVVAVCADPEEWAYDLGWTRSHVEDTRGPLTPITLPGEAQP